MTRSFIALGSNQGDRLEHLRAARQATASLEGVSLCASSSVYQTAPVGPAGQDDYFNAVIEIESDWPAGALLDALLAIEQERGRVRQQRWGPRTIDLDILLHGDEVVNQPGLTVPHPRMGERAFVMVPLAAMAPDLVHPVVGRSMRELCDAIDPASVRLADVQW